VPPGWRAPRAPGTVDPVPTASDAADPLPDDVPTLQRRLQASESEVQLLKLMLDKLRLQLARRNRAEFGASSERFDDAQGTLLETAALDELAARKATTKLAANTPEVDRSLSAHLPREAHVHRPEVTAAHHDAAGQPCGCSACGGRLRQIGQDVSEQLEYVPARFKVIRHVRPKLACVDCEAIFQASAPSRPIPRGVAGPALLAHVMVSKYCDHLPLYRQSRIYAREGVEIDRSTMAGWVEQADALLDPLVAALGRYVLAAQKVHADDTPVKVLAPGRGKTKTGRLWVYVRDDRPAGNKAAPAAWFRYSPDRKGEWPQAHLAKYAGILQADAYGGWTNLYDSGRVTEAACWAHARRPWWDLYLSTGRNEDSIAAQALRRIRELYKIEEEIRGQSPEVRCEQRQARAGPLLKDLHAWFGAILARVSTKSELAQAARYSLVRWKALTRYVDDGSIEIDNNAAERALRGVGLGRNNYLFMGSDGGGERAASMYSLVETAKLNGLDPEAYLREVFDRIAEHPVNRIEDLLPWNIGGKSETHKLAA
jgi:transposase